MGIFGVKHALLPKGAQAAAKLLVFSMAAAPAWSCVAYVEGDDVGGEAVADADAGEFVRQTSQAVLVNDNPYLAANRANLVPDSSFEFVGTKQWQAWSGQSTFRTVTKAYSGHHSIKVTDSSTTNSAGVVTQRVPAVPGRAYTASAWVQRTSGTGIPTIYLQFHDGLGSGTSDRIEARTVDVPVSNSTWKTASVSGVAPVGTRYVDVLVYSSSAEVSTFYVDDVALVAQDNLVPNGSFSEVESAIPIHWSLWEDTEIASHAVGFDGDGVWMPDNSTDKARGLMSGRFAVFPGQELTATGRSKYSGSRPALFVRFFESRTSTSPLVSRVEDFPQGSGWQLASLTAEVPVGAQYAEVLVYSCLACTGTAYFDDIRVTSARNLLLNGDAEDTESQEWTGSFSYSTAAEVTGERSIRFEDSSTSESVAVRTQPLPVIAGRSYELSGAIRAIAGDGFPTSDDCEAWLAVEFYPSMTRTSTSDRISTDIAPVTADFAGLTCAQHGNRWVSRRLQLTAPKGAYAAKVLLYSSLARRGRYYADGVRFGEVPAPTPSRTFFVGPSASGNGDGSTLFHRAKYSDAAFWESRVLPALATSAAEVVFIPSQYKLKVNDTDRLRIEAGAFATDFPLTVRGQYATGSAIIHDSSGADADSFWKDNMFSFKDFESGLTFQDLTFTGASEDPNADNEDYRVGGALNVSRASNVEVRNVGFLDLHGIDYGAFKPSNSDTEDPMSGVLVRDSYGARIGYDSHAHFVYCANDVENLQFVGNFFEDDTGTYIKLRNNCDDVAVIRNRFQSTGTFYNPSTSAPERNRNTVFVEWNSNNDGIPESNDQHTCFGSVVTEKHAAGNEGMGKLRTILEGNLFEYLEPYTDDISRHAYRIDHSGFNPPDQDPTDGLGPPHPLDLLSHNSLTLAEIEDHFRIDGDDWIDGARNDFVGERAGQIAQVKIWTRKDKFWDVDSGKCFDMRTLHATEKRDFYIDSLLSLP